MSLKVKGYRLLVKADDVETRSPGGIIKVVNEDLEKAAMQAGTVIGVGDQCWHNYEGDPWCKVGDRVMFSKYSGKFICDPDDENAEYLIMNDEDILLVVGEDG